MTDPNSTEKWLPVVGYEGLYEVSDQGRIRSVDRFIIRSGKWKGHKYWLKGRLLLFMNNKGYSRVGLRKNNKQKPHHVHRLVLESFLGPCPTGMECRHFPDNDRSNNNLCNLSWSTRKQNQADKNIHGTQLIGEKNSQSKFKRRDIELMFSLRAEGSLLKDIAKQFDTDMSYVCKILNGRQWKHIQSKSHLDRAQTHL